MIKITRDTVGVITLSITSDYVEVSKIIHEMVDDAGKTGEARDRIITFLTIGLTGALPEQVRLAKSLNDLYMMVFVGTSKRVTGKLEPVYHDFTEAIEEQWPPAVAAKNLGVAYAGVNFSATPFEWLPMSFFTFVKDIKASVNSFDSAMNNEVVAYSLSTMKSENRVKTMSIIADLFYGALFRDVQHELSDNELSQVIMNSSRAEKFTDTLMPLIDDYIDRIAHGSTEDFKQIMSLRGFKKDIASNPDIADRVAYICLSPDAAAGKAVINGKKCPSRVNGLMQRLGNDTFFRGSDGEVHNFGSYSHMRTLGYSTTMIRNDFKNQLKDGVQPAVAVTGERKTSVEVDCVVALCEAAERQGWIKRASYVDDPDITAHFYQNPHSASGNNNAKLF